MMYYLDNTRHKKPHIHVKYQSQEAVISIPEGRILEGKIKVNKLKIILAWIEIHKDELMADWELAVNGEKVLKIEPLR